jgi:hypothetical protein
MKIPNVTITEQWLIVLAIATLAFHVICAVILADNADDARNQLDEQPNAFEAFLDKCRPVKFDELGRATAIQCRLEPELNGTLTK